ncbi:MAG TPA: Ig-like domain-containing protein [Nitrospirota bacterium]|nr:Ig-like domain-containing protein [Nitrospirota bacterium]
MKFKSLVLTTLVMSLPVLAVPAFAGSPAAVEMFSPQGTVKNVRQVQVRFSEQMVPFGDPRLVEPFDIKCPGTGRARWADGKNWIYDFDKDLPAGEVCEFTVKAGLKTLAGNEVSGTQKFTFSTGGPAIRDSRPYEGSTVQEDQIFIVTLDAEPKFDTVREHAYCAVEGINEKVGIKIIDDESVLKELSAATSVRYSRRRWRGVAAQGEAPEPQLVLQCKQRFPANAEVKLSGVKVLNQPAA